MDCCLHYAVVSPLLRLYLQPLMMMMRLRCNGSMMVFEHSFQKRVKMATYRFTRYHAPCAGRSRFSLRTCWNLVMWQKALKCFRFSTWAKGATDCFGYSMWLLHWRPGWKRKRRKRHHVGSLNLWVIGFIKSSKERTRINQTNTNKKKKRSGGCASGTSGQRDKIPEGTTCVPASSLLA